MIQISSTRPDYLLGAPRLPRLSKNAPEVECFRVRLFSGDRISGTTIDSTYSFDFPLEIGDGYHLAVETCMMSGGTAPTAASDRIYNFSMQGLPFRKSFVARGNPESDGLFSTVRQTDTLYITRPITQDTIGIPLSDLGQIRNRTVRVYITNGAGAAHPDTGLTAWMLNLLIYKKV